MKVNEPAQKQSTDKTCARAKWLLSGTFREVQDARRHEEHCVKLCCTTEVRKEHRWQVAAADLNTGHNHGSVRGTDEQRGLTSPPSSFTAGSS